MGKTRVLFLCTGNSARSQMAEAFLREIAGDRFEVHSAGLTPKGLHPLTAQVMQEAGIDVSRQESKDVKIYMGREHFPYVVTVCADADANCPHALWSRGQRLHWPFDDPASVEGDEALSKFREVRDQIRAKIEAWVAETMPA